MKINDPSLPSWWRTSHSDVLPVCWLVISRSIKDPIRGDIAFDKKSSTVKIDNGLSTEVVLTRSGVESRFPSITKAIAEIGLRMSMYKYYHAKNLKLNGFCVIDDNTSIRRVHGSGCSKD